jgi:hypothetical protein
VVLWVETCINILGHSSASLVSMFSRRSVISPGAEAKVETASQLAEAKAKADGNVEVVKSKGSNWRGVRWAADV